MFLHGDIYLFHTPERLSIQPIIFFSYSRLNVPVTHLGLWRLAIVPLKHNEGTS